MWAIELSGTINRPSGNRGRRSGLGNLEWPRRPNGRGLWLGFKSGGLRWDQQSNEVSQFERPTLWWSQHRQQGRSRASLLRESSSMAQIFSFTITRKVWNSCVKEDRKIELVRDANYNVFDSTLQSSDLLDVLIRKHAFIQLTVDELFQRLLFKSPSFGWKSVLMCPQIALTEVLTWRHGNQALCAVSKHQ